MPMQTMPMKMIEQLPNEGMLAEGSRDRHRNHPPAPSWAACRSTGCSSPPRQSQAAAPPQPINKPLILSSHVEGHVGCEVLLQVHIRVEALPPAEAVHHRQRREASARRR